MKVLVVNAGSSSLKYQLIDMDNESVICKGGIESIGLGTSSKFTHKINGKSYVTESPLADHTEAFNALIKVLTTGEGAAIKDTSEIDAIGHRVLHAGEDFSGSVVVDDKAIELMKKNIELGPLHMPANIKCIELCREIFKGTPNVAVFDTAFHMTMPPYAYMYAIRYKDYKKYHVRKYGFHGTSHKYISSEAIKMLGNPKHSKIITCHLGNGSSITAVKDGKSIDTSMGLTPLEGVMMGTRSGDIDPAAVRFLMKKKRMSIDRALDYLNNKCGYLGVSEVSNDSRKVIEASWAGSRKAKLALDMSFYRMKKYIGAYAAAMNGVDCIVFAGGIGENSWFTRDNVMRNMEYLGIDFDFEKNKTWPRGQRGELSTPNSKVKVFVIPTDEEMVIAKETMDLVK